MILGTHNSLSYAKPTKWWMKLINFTSRCQNMTIEEQFKYGVRYYDIRIRLEKDTSAHGIIEYDVKVSRILSYLNEKVKGSNVTCYVAINLEENVDFKDEHKVNLFRKTIKNIQNKYPNLIICGGYCKGPWRKILPEIYNPATLDYYWEFMNFKCKNKISIIQLITNILHFCPKYWAKRDNKGIKELAKTYTNPSEILVLDYVQY